MAAVVRVRDFHDVLDTIAKPLLAESWDNIGLMVGEPDLEISAILVALDPTVAILAEAKRKGCNVIVTHHPLIFKGLKSLRTDLPEGKILAGAVRDRVAIFGCHTNLDKASGGVSDMLAARIGLVNSRVLLPEPDESGAVSCGFGRIGELSAPLSFADFIVSLRAELGLRVVKVAGASPEVISRVAVCGGSGSDLAPLARAAGAQIYVSGEIKHSMARWAEEVEFCIVDGGHFATEKVMVLGLAKLLRSGFAKLGLAVEVLTTESQTCPFRYY